MSTGKDLLKIAARHLGERYRLGAIAPKNNKEWKGPWDCAEFCSWVVYQMSGTLYGCNTDSDPALADAYTGFWARDARSKGKQITVAEALRTPGAALLRIPAPNLIGHIAFSDGFGGTIEAHSTNRGVIRTKATNRRWDMGVLVPGIRYEQEVPVVMPTNTVRVLRLTDPLMRGEQVKRVQRALRAAGYHPGSIDGVYGPKTTAAVYAYQVSKGLVPDGECGPATARSLKITWP
jgi:hypothetical protein